MKIVLQDTETKLLFKDFYEWTPSENGALTFPNTKSALKFCIENRLTNVQLIIIFKDGSKCLRYAVPQTLEGKVVDRTGRFFVPHRAERFAVAA